MAKYKVATLTKKNIASLNKDVIEAVLIDGSGTQIEKVQIWQGFPNFDSITFDSEVEGDIQVKVNGKYTNTTLYAPKAVVARQGGSNAAIGKAMERKETSIAKFQDSKEIGIKLSSSMRDAVQLAICELSDSTDKNALASRIKHWRNWILENWGDEKDVTNPF